MGKGIRRKEKGTIKGMERKCKWILKLHNLLRYVIIIYQHGK